MKIFYKNSILTTLLFSFYCFTNFTLGQTSFELLNGNSVAASINDGLNLFNNPYTSASGYEVPAGGNNHLIFASSMLFGGTNQNGELRISYGKYALEQDFYRGPHSSTLSYLDTGYLYSYDKTIWKVSKDEIIYHIDNVNQPNYAIPNNILEWPGNGNPNVGVASKLAPFVDLNNNDIYEPQLGEYPCIKGDESVYSIVHDIDTNGVNIGVEIHLMAYQIASNNFIDSTTFLEISIINKGNNVFNDFKGAIFVDPDIGFSEDDYIGSAPAKNMMYAYNSDNHDEGEGGAPGFGSNPPAVGVVSLNKQIEFSGYFNRAGLGFPSATLFQRSTEVIWNYMNGKWSDSTYWTNGGSGYGGTTPTQHMYDGNPYLGTGWTEINTNGSGQANDSGDRRFIMVSEENSFSPGDTLHYHYAVITDSKGDHLENAHFLYRQADAVQQFYSMQNWDCTIQGTGTPDPSLAQIPNPLLGFEITRVDGEGNMALPVMITPETEQHILDSGVVQSITYQRDKGPISARLTDTVNHVTGHFVLKFNQYTDIDSASWTVYHYDTLGGMLIDSVNSNEAINIGTEQFISQWKMAIQIKQIPYHCQSPGANCSPLEMTTDPIFDELTFDNPNAKWLTGVKDSDGAHPTNWIKSSSNLFISVPNPLYDQNCFHQSFANKNGNYSNLVNGIVSPGTFVNLADCFPSAIGNSSHFGNSGSLYSLSNRQMRTIHQPSVDIVFTSDTSNWTRCPVIELNKNAQVAINGGKAGLLRQSPSVDKLGNPDGTGTGMGWFPGYAIDVETGRRLNMAFCENSNMTADNGGDMIWNPTERLQDNSGNFVFGGQHAIYVFGGESDSVNVPAYDNGAFIHQNLAAETIEGFRKVYSSLSWVVRPLLSTGATINASDARMKLRLNKEFKTRVISNRNEGRPMFTWDVVPYNSLVPSQSSSLSIYPNPATNSFNVVWNNITTNAIQLYSLQGNQINNVNIQQKSGQKSMDISGLNSGIYIVKVGNSIKKLVVQ